MNFADKPPIEELQQFLEYQLPRQWAPVYGDLPLGFGAGYRKNTSPSLKFSLTGPKLYVNTTKVPEILTLNILNVDPYPKYFCFSNIRIVGLF